MRRGIVAASLIAAALAAGSFFAGRASSDEPPAAGGGMDPEKMAEWMKMMTPGPEHELLKGFVGTWMGKGSFTEGGPEMSFTEDFVATSVFGGRFLKMDATMQMAGVPMPMTSVMYLGFDNAKQKYVQTMVGDMSTAIGTCEGTYDAATKTFSMGGTEATGAGKERKFALSFKIVSADEWAFTMSFSENGKETGHGTATYTRRK